MVNICKLHNSITTVLPTVAIILFAIAGVVFLFAITLAILGWFFKQGKTQEQDPYAYKLYNFGIIGLTIFGATVVLAVLALIFYIITPTLLSILTGVPLEFC